MIIEQLIILANFIGPTSVIFLIFYFKISIKKSLNAIAKNQKIMTALQMFLEGNQEVLKLKMDKTIDERLIQLLKNVSIDSTNLKDSLLKSASEIVQKDKDDHKDDK